MKKKKTFLKLFFLLLIIVSSVNLVKYYKSYKSSKDIYESIYKNPDEAAKKINGKDEENITNLFSRYYDNVVGYIDITNTKVHYPIVQYTDNDFYLSHDIEKKYSISGSIFLDYSNKSDFTDDNSIIYGHNMKSGDFFNSLLKFRDQSFYDENNIIKVSNLDKTEDYIIFSVHISDPDYDYRKIHFNNMDEKINYIKKLKDKSLINTHDLNISALESSKIITLSTCTNFGNLRFAVHGIVY